MDLLTIRHEDFTMYVECSKFEGIWNKAKGNVGEENLLSTYTWSDGVEAADDIRLAFELAYSRSLSTSFFMINTNGMIKDTFIDTTFENLNNLNHG